MPIRLGLLRKKGRQAARRLISARPRKRTSIALVVYAVVVGVATLGVAIFVGDSSEGRGWQTNDDGKGLVALLPASEYRSPGDSDAKGWAYLYVMCNRQDRVMRLGVGLGTEAALKMSGEDDTEVGVWKVVYRVGDAGVFADVWTAVMSGESAYLSPPEPRAVSDRFLAGGLLVAWTAELGSLDDGHKAIFDLDGYAEDVASEMGGCGGPLRA